MQDVCVLADIDFVGCSNSSVQRGRFGYKVPIFTWCLLKIILTGVHVLLTKADQKQFSVFLLDL